MITQDDALGAVHQRLYAGLPEGTVLHLWNTGAQLQDVDLAIAEGDRARLSAALGIGYDGADESPLKMALEQRAVALWTAIEVEQGPLVSEDEYQCLQKARTSALQLFSRAAVAALAHMMDDAGGDYTGWSDNGGDPDGPTWLLWPCDTTLLAAAERCAVAYEQVEGFELEYPQELSRNHDAPGQSPFPLQGPWSGVSCAAAMLVANEEDAVGIIRWLKRQEEREEVAS